MSRLVKEGRVWTDGLAHLLGDIVVETQPTAKHLLSEQVSIEDYIGNISWQEELVIQLLEDVFGYF